MMSNSKESSKGGKPCIHKAVFIPAFVLLVIFTAMGIFQTDVMGDFLTATLYKMSDSVGWYYELLALVVIVLAVAIAFTRFGNIRIGGKDAKPDFKLLNWIVMAICGGLGTGLLFWAMGEPVYHYMQPPAAAGVEAMSREAAVFAVSQDMWIWSFAQFAIYGFCGLAFALIAYNLKKPLSYHPVVEIAFGKSKKSTLLSNIIHAVTIFTMCAASACALAVPVMQIGAGLEQLTGIPQSNLVYFVITAIITVGFVLSCVSGLGTGLKKMASFTAVIFIVIMIYVLICGPREFIAKLGTEAFGDMLVKWPQKTLILNAMSPDDKWFADWPVQYIASYLVYAPTLGMFQARLAKGRTVREFILVNIVAKAAFVIFWIGVFGSLEMYFQTTGTFDVWEAIGQYGIQATLFLIIDQFPFGGVLIFLFLIAIFLSAATLSDPVASALATLSAKGITNIDEEAPKGLKIVIGAMMGVITFMLILSGGVNAVKGMWVIVALPISFLMIIIMITLFKSIRKVAQKEDFIVDEDEL